MRDDKLDKMDKATSFAERALDMLFIRNPSKTGLGVLLGVVLHTVSDNVIRITKIAVTLPIYFWIAVGILSLNLRNLLFAQHTIDEELEVKMHYIKEAQKSTKFTESEKRQQWRNFIALVNKKALESMDTPESGQSGKGNNRTAAQ
ncbi:MAG: hypothetical protein IKN96_07420 [Oscillibacter sp.]|nr:hypothetical protein [Oscillibacter sp.]